MTLLCIDQFGARFPLHHQQSGLQGLLTFFKAIEVRTGQVTANAFMSDDAPAFFNAWKNVMGEPKHCLLCAWHIDKNWQERIKRHIRDANLQAFTHKVCRSVWYLRSLDSTGGGSRDKNVQEFSENV